MDFVHRLKSHFNLLVSLALVIAKVRISHKCILKYLIEYLSFYRIFYIRLHSLQVFLKITYLHILFFFFNSLTGVFENFDKFKATVQQIRNKSVSVSCLKTTIEFSSVVTSPCTNAIKYMCNMQQCEVRRTNTETQSSKHVNHPLSSRLKASLDNVLAKYTGLTEL